MSEDLTIGEAVPTSILQQAAVAGKVITPYRRGTIHALYD